MSKPVMITADSTCDLSEDLLNRYKVKILPLTILLGEESFLDGAHSFELNCQQRQHYHAR